MVKPCKSAHVRNSYIAVWEQLIKMCVSRVTGESLNYTQTNSLNYTQTN